MNLLRLLLALLAGWTAGLILILASLYFSNGGYDFTVTDIMGFGVIFLVTSGLLMLLLYYPTLRWRQRRFGDNRALLWSPLLAGVVLNIPVLILLTFLAGRNMSRAEAITMIATYVSTGAAFALVFAFATRTVSLRPR